MKNYISKKLIPVLAANAALVVGQFVYVALRVGYLNELIPLWHTLPWGIQQLASRGKLVFVPLMALLIVVLGATFASLAKRRFLRYGEEFIYMFVSLCNVLLAYSVFRVVQIASTPAPPLINPGFVQLVPTMLISGAVVYLIAPKILDALKGRNIVTDPQVHKHPGMLLTRPSIRGGGAIFALGVLITSIFLLRHTQIVTGVLISVALGAILGILDDIQNTSPIAKLKFIENPVNRVLLQGLVVLPVIFAGVQIMDIGNPFGGAIFFDTWKLNAFGLSIAPLSILFTLLWTMWIMNVLSWSNGVDGQFSGIVGIAAIVLALITMRETPLTLQQKDMVTLAAIAAGASFGLLPYTWHPSKTLWGFGAVSAGVILATISTLTKAKIAAALIVLAVPFLDGVIAVTRRVLQGKSPFKGDRGHFHHVLLERGWSVQKVAVFYWVSTAVTGYIGIKSADRNPMLAALTLAGLVAFLIVTANIKKKPKSKTEITQLASDSDA